MVRAVVIVSGSSVTALVLGFVKNALAAYYFGTSIAMDTYLVALLLPDVVIQLARAGSFNFIPLFGAERQRSEEDAWSAAGKMLTYWLLLLLGVLLVAAVVMPLVMPLLAPGFDPERRGETLDLARGLFLMSASLGAGRILAVVLQAEKRFLTSGLADVVLQVGSIAFLVAFHGVGIRGLVWAQVFGGNLHLLVAAVGLLPWRHRLRAGLDLSGGPVRKLIRLNWPVYLGDSGDKVNQMVTRAFASLLPPGAVSALQFAYFPVDAVHRMLTLSLVSAFFPFLSMRFARRDQRKARASLGRALVASTLAFLPLSAVVWLLADPMVVLLFERGNFDRSSTALTASALRLFAPAIFALGLNELLGSAFHARQDTLTPMRAGFVRVLCNVTLCAALTPLLGHRGLALAATLSLFFKLTVLAWSTRRVFDPAERRRILRPMARIVLAASVMTAVLYPILAFYYPTAWIQNHALRSLCGLGAVCLSVYAVALRLLDRRQFLWHAAVVRRALRWRRHPSPFPPVETPPRLRAEGKRVGG